MLKDKEVESIGAGDVQGEEEINTLPSLNTPNVGADTCSPVDSTPSIPSFVLDPLPEDMSAHPKVKDRSPEGWPNGKPYMIGNRRWMLPMMGRYTQACQGIDKGVKQCGLSAKRGTLWCTKHTPSSASEGLTPDSTALTAKAPKVLDRELILVRNYVNKLVRMGVEPSTINKVNDLHRMMSNLNDSVKATITQEQLKQLGYYFGSILFNYIQDGNAYERAKADMVDALVGASIFDKKELEATLRLHSEKVTPPSLTPGGH